MLPKALIKGYDKRRLRNLLLIFFLALTIPTTVLIRQAYSQLKWEAFHQYRGLAEELTSRIDARLIDMVHRADVRSFADYSFLVVTGDPAVNFLQRSPLSAYPVTGDPPGLIGYFQVDTGGAFSSPLLPPEGSDPQQFGIGADELGNRLQLTQEIREILADNRLVRVGSGMGPSLVTATPVMLEASLEEDMEADRDYSAEERARRPGNESEASLSAGPAGAAGASLEEAAGAWDESARGEAAIDKLEAMPSEPVAVTHDTYSQQVFDQLNMPRQDEPPAPGDAAGGGLDDAAGRAASTQQRLNTMGKVSDLQLDAAYEQKSEEVERQLIQLQQEDKARAIAAARSKRREQIALPETAIPADGGPDVSATADLRISTFQSEVDPLDFSMLDSGHLVLFRKVWRGGERYIQGLLIDQQAFIEDAIDRPFMETALSGISHLIVARGEDVIHTVSGCDAYNCPYGNQGLDGALVFRGRLSAPLDAMELIFSISRLPPGPGATVLGWVTLILTLVFISGFYTLYRLGSSQINLARQQQDFVSAVSHELKTPLTSIRMYGEMLKEGWADEEKQKTYYEYIHDESDKITRNEPQFDLKPVMVGELMGNIESKIASQAESAGFRLVFERDDETDRLTVMIDEDCFAQIIINLVDNAIKFSAQAENKTIEINSSLTGNRQVRFSVRDFGPGIPRSQMKKIFQLFYRPESELTRETVGTGIGLAIVHQLTLAMGGKVDVINREVGAEFTVTF
jgi:signal transduction histidine kinase